MKKRVGDMASVLHGDSLIKALLWCLMLGGIGLIVLAGRGDAVWEWPASRSLPTAFVGFALFYIGASIRFGS
jgi:hypothetical protein